MRSFDQFDSVEADQFAIESYQSPDARSLFATMVLHNPNNWHWVNKDVSVWTREYLDKDLAQISAEKNGVTAKIDKVVSMDGDVDVSQRKGKVITIFDVKLKLEYSGMSFS